MLQKEIILINVCNPVNVYELGGPARFTLVIHKYETYYRLSTLLLSIFDQI